VVVNPNSFRVGYFNNNIVEQPDPSFFDTLKASLGYSYAPAYNMIANSTRYSPQEGYDWKEDIEGYELFAPQLYHAVSPQHMSALKQQIEESASRRQVLQNSSILAQFGAGIFDPINLIALPFGGPAIGIGRSALRVGAGVAALEAGVELTRQSDPLQTAQEGAINVMAAGLFGAGFGAAFGGIKTRAYTKTKAALEEEFQMVRRFNLMGDITPDILKTPRAERRFGNDSDEYLVEQIKMFDTEAARAESESIKYADTPQAGMFAARSEEMKGYSQVLKQEQAMRELEAMGLDMDDPFRIMNSAYTDSFLYKAVTTPMKRALQSKYPTVVKETFVKSFGDSGIALALNSVGLPTPQSVHQRSAVNRGKFVRAHDQLLTFWRDDTNAVPSSKLDIDLGVISRRISRSENSYKKWLVRVNEKRINKVTDLTDNEAKAIEVINKYFEDAQIRLEDVGLIGTQKGIEKRIQQLEAKINDLNERLVVAESKRTKKSIKQIGLLQTELNRLGSKLGNERQSLLGLEDLEPNREINDVFFPRFWDKGAIRKNRSKFSETLFKWYSENPYVYELDKKTAQFVRKELDTRPDKIQERVDLTIDRILGEIDSTSVDNIGFGYGRSKHFRHRQVDIPNNLVTEFIVTDPLAAMKTYAARVEPRIEYAKMFGQDVEGVMFDLEYDMISKGFSEKDINRMRRDYLHLYDRVAGSVIHNDDLFSRLSQSTAAIIRDAASLNYLGSAGFAAFPDFARIIMEHDMENVIRGMQVLMDKNKVDLAVNETRYSGEAIDIFMGSAHLRLHDDLANSLDANELLNNARNAFHIMNGLGPITVLAKQLAGIVDAHSIIDYSIRYNQLTKQELTWLSKYGIGKEQAEKIAKSPWEKTDNGLYLANTDAWNDSIPIPEVDGKRISVLEINKDGSPVGKLDKNGDYVAAFYREKENKIYFDRNYIEGKQFDSKAWLNPRKEGIDALPDVFKTPRQWSNFVMLHEVMHSRSRPKKGETNIDYENRINRMALDEWKKQTTINEETVYTFKSALNSGVLNTIMAATPADKPIINDGIVYIPSHIGEAFGFKKDPKFKGYTRIENGFLGLPFQFYSYMLANVNKTVGAFAQGQVKNRMLGVSAAFGLAYMSLSIRTPDYVWNDMNWRDKFARTFDMSGIGALYSDLFYTGLHTSLALGGPNITNGIISPKFPQEPSMLDAITGIAGAGPSWTADTATGIYEFASGEYGEGARTIVRNLPFARMWFLKDDVNQITRAWAQ
jgi:hypothetical protein